MLDEIKSAARKVNSARHLRGLLIDCRRLLSERGEANSVAIARNVVARFRELPEDEQASFFERLSRDFSPDPKLVLRHAQAYAESPNAQTLLSLTRSAEPPRQELLRRINRSPGGTGSIVAMRRALLARVNKQPELQAVEADFLHLLSSWFNPGFLRLQRVDWNSPAQLLEQIIRHEAVHTIDGWDDLRRRLQPDRRCFAFFHPQLPDEPLIFVEVALLPAMPEAIAPLIDKASEPLPPAQFKVAAFYSISNCQPGLKGVSLGNFLIKRVAEELKRELPQLRTFCTLSPIPGFARWVRAGAPCAGLTKTRSQWPRSRTPAAAISTGSPMPPACAPCRPRPRRRCCAWAPTTSAGTPPPRAATRWHASTSTTAPVSNGSTLSPTCRPRACASPSA
jgi:malonyl-CoA decarboxylase